MAQSAATLSNVIKEVWTDNALQKQFFADDGPLSRFESVSGTMIGSQASVPVWNDLNSGGYTSIGAGGGALNPATNQPTNKALYTLVYHYFPISLETSALNQAAGPGLASTVSAKNLEITGALASLRNQATRQLVTNGDGIVAQLAANTSVNTLALVASPSATAYGYDAIVRNWLRPGAVVDIGTAADSDAIATGVTVTAVAESSSAPTITVSGSALTTTTSHFVTIANPNSTTATNPELNGLRNLVAQSGAIGGLNPATAGQEFWQAALRDTSTATFALDVPLNLHRRVVQKSGKDFSDVWTSLQNQQRFYKLLQNQVRFAGDANMGAGHAGFGPGNGGPTWNGMRVTGYPAILDSDWWQLTLSDFVRVTGQGITKPTWMSNLGGDASPGGIWHQGFTDFVDAITYPFQIGLRRRNTQAGATALTA